jgi:hypothetical protein
MRDKPQGLSVASKSRGNGWSWSRPFTWAFSDLPRLGEGTNVRGSYLMRRRLLDRDFGFDLSGDHRRRVRPHKSGSTVVLSKSVATAIDG